MKWYPQLDDEFYLFFFIQKSSGLFNYLKFFFFLIRWLLKPSDHMCSFQNPCSKSHQKEPLGAGEKAQGSRACCARVREMRLELGAPVPTGGPTHNPVRKPRQGLAGYLGYCVSKLTGQGRDLALIRKCSTSGLYTHLSTCMCIQMGTCKHTCLTPHRQLKKQTTSKPSWFQDGAPK